MSFLDLDLDLEDDLALPQKEDSSSTVDIVVAAVAVEFERDENFMRLPSAVVVVWVIVEDRLAVVLDRLWPLIEPPKKSPFEDVGRVLNKLRDIASSPNICALERTLNVGVEGAELLPVRNLNRPNWCTCKMSSVYAAAQIASHTHSFVQCVLELLLIELYHPRFHHPDPWT
jgi:hypothetical protein